MILGDLATLIGGKINMTDALTLTKIKAWAERRHSLVCDMELWKDLLSLYTISVAANQSEVICPQQIDRVVGAKYDWQNLMPVDQVFLFASDPAIWDRTGTPARMAELPSVGVAVMPASEKVTFVSTNVGDTTQKVSLVGELAGVEVRETLTLNGTSVVVSMNSYDLLYTCSKQLTTGNVTVKGQTSATTLETLLADESERKHCRLRLLETPVNTLTLLVLGKRRPTPYRQDSDAPAVRGISAALEAFTLADAYEWLKQNADAAGKRQEAQAMMDIARDKEVFQSANIQQLVPYDAFDNAGELTGKAWF